MFGFGGSKKTATPSQGRAKLLGVDMTASRVRALAAAGADRDPGANPGHVRRHPPRLRLGLSPRGVVAGHSAADLVT